MSNSNQSDSDEASSNATLSTNRRRVLQGIGTAGIAGVAGVSPVQAQQPNLDNATIHGEENEIAIGTQFWTYFANSNKSVAELIYESADAGYDIVEPFMFDDNEAISTALEETDVEMGSAHVGVGDLEGNDEFIQTLSDFGANHLVHAYQGRDTFSDESSIEEFAAASTRSPTGSPRRIFSTATTTTTTSSRRRSATHPPTISSPRISTTTPTSRSMQDGS